MLKLELLFFSQAEHDPKINVELVSVPPGSQVPQYSFHHTAPCQIFNFYWVKSISCFVLIINFIAFIFFTKIEAKLLQALCLCLSFHFYNQSKSLKVKAQLRPAQFLVSNVLWGSLLYRYLDCGLNSSILIGLLFFLGMLSCKMNRSFDVVDMIFQEVIII